MRLIYVDEAGTSALEPVRIVAAVIVHGDREWRRLEAELEKVFDAHVPAQFRDGFHFHATEVFSGGKKKIWQKDWPFEERLDFLKEVVSLPFVHDIPIALGLSFNGRFKDTVLAENPSTDFPLVEHAIAFAECIERADYFLRYYLHDQEIGTIVAENVNDKKAILAQGAMMFRDNPLQTQSEHFQQSAIQKEFGIVPDAITLEVRNIIDVPHFVEKRKAPMLQLADACAFSFRRYLAKLTGEKTWFTPCSAHTKASHLSMIQSGFLEGLASLIP